MNKYPPSILVALYAALASTGLFVGAFAYAGATLSDLLIFGIIFFTITLLLFTLGVEFVIYRRIKLLEQNQEKEIRKLKEIEVIRREFIGNVSHELKTPIFAIEGFIETLLSGAIHDDKVNRKFLKKALKQSERLSTLVQDLLVITKIESGEMEMKMRKFNMYELVTEVAESLEHKLTKKSRNVELKIDPGGQEENIVLGDRERIEQVLYNLVDNAIKYGDAQGEVNISLEKLSDDKLLIRVKDNGPGIDPKHLPRLFERFYRVDKSRSRDKGGTGLGLSICKHLIEAHSERIWVESEPGNGSTFLFTMTIA